MIHKLVCSLLPQGDNGRNSEGDFLRAPNGEIWFAYSRFVSADSADDGPSDVYMIRSADEGETWSAPECIARAADFDTWNIMSVSAMPLLDGTPCFYFLIKEMDGSSGIGRTRWNGEEFTTERCALDMPAGYFVINNQRFIRLRNGRILVPIARHENGPLVDKKEQTLKAGYVWLRVYDKFEAVNFNSTVYLLVSKDDGMSFQMTDARITLSGGRSFLQEPGILEMQDGSLWLWARTALGCQYQCWSTDEGASFTLPEPTIFTSPLSPMSVYRTNDSTLYAAYNPDPDKRRTPFVLRHSDDDGMTWSGPVILEEDPERGYCYTAMFETRDGSLLAAYCRGLTEQGLLNELGIMKLRRSMI